MVYMSQEHKKIINNLLKKVIPKSWKWSLAVEHLSTIVLTIRSADVDLIKEIKEQYKIQADKEGIEESRRSKIANYITVNEYYIQEYFNESKEIFDNILSALNEGNWNRSDIQSDYFDIGHYVCIHIGKWDKPFIFTESKALCNV